MLIFKPQDGAEISVGYAGVQYTQLCCALGREKSSQFNPSPEETVNAAIDALTAYDQIIKADIPVEYYPFGGHPRIYVPSGSNAEGFLPTLREINQARLDLHL